MDKNYRKIIYIIGIVMVIVGLPFSKPIISMGEMLIFGNWLFDKNLPKKLKSFVTNKFALLFSSLFFLLAIGLFWTEDFHYALTDLRTKVPLLIFPLVLSSLPAFSKKEIKTFLMLFAAMVFISIGISFFVFLTKNMADSRDAFTFVSHIRMGIMAYLSICILVYYLVIEKGERKWKSIIIVFAIIGFLVFLIALELMTGMLILLISGFIFLVSIILLSTTKKVRIGFSIVFVILTISSFISIYSIFKDYQFAPKYTLSALPVYTQNGNLYSHNPDGYPIENGSYIGLFICQPELKTEWQKRSKISLDSLDNANQPLNYTLIRFLNSKHLTKDSVGVSRLSDNEIHSIENGVANCVYLESFSIKKRIYKMLWEWNLYENDGLFAGQSVTQRFVLWKTGIEIFQKNFLFGVGTGDIPNAFKEELKENKNLLMNSNLRSHNQYISTAVTFGIFGLLLFLLVLFLPILIQNPKQNWLYFSFAIAIILSMFWEDTLETQVGVTIYAFFNSFYWFVFKGKTKTMREFSNQ